MALNMLDEDDMLRDLPCVIIALMIHGALLSAPVLRWGAGAAKQAAPQAVNVDFVAAVPLPPPPPPAVQAPSPALAPVPAGADREGVPRKGEGVFKAQKKPAPKARLVALKHQQGKQAPARLKRAPLVVRAKAKPQPDPAALQAAAQRKARLLAIAAENARIREEKLRAARLAAAAVAEKKAEEERERRQEEARRAEEKRQAELEARQARARRRADARQALAMMADPDETLSDAVADRPSEGAVAGSPKGRGTLEAALPSATTVAAKMRDGQEAVYEMDEAGSGTERVKASGGGKGADGGGLNWSLEGPAGSRRLLRRALPSSPAWVSERGLELSVQVKFQVQPDGSVKAGAVVKRTSGFPEIDQRALDALKKWRFDSAPAKAGPETWGVVTFRFLMG
jgi:TolA protein